MENGLELFLQSLQFCAYILEVSIGALRKEEWCTIFGVLCALIGFQAYISKPDDISFATWLMFVAGDALEAGSYFVMTRAALVMNAIPLTFALGSFVVFVLALKRKQFDRPDWKDTAVMGADGVITAGWFMGKWGAVGANLMAVSTEVISFIPAGRDILKGKERPYVAPWMWWAAADGFFLLAAVFHLKLDLLGIASIAAKGDWESVYYPFLQMLAHFGIVGCILIRRRYERRLSTR